MSRGRVALSVALLLLSCRSRERVEVTPAAAASASAPARPAAPPTGCASDDDCAPMNCCYASSEASCIPKGRANCDKFKVECAAYDGPRYACACAGGVCVGTWATAGSAPDAGAAASTQPSIASGELGASAVLDVIMKHAPDVRACRARSPKALGVVTMGWTVRPAGTAFEPKVISGAGVDPTLAACLGKKIGGWRFPKAKGPTRVTYAFRFG